MDALGNNSNYSIPIYFKDQANDLKSIEAEAKRALQNINTLYGEIMHTDCHDNFEVENNTDSHESPSSSISVTEKQPFTTTLNTHSETSKKFYFHSNLPLSHCVDCRNRYYDNSLTSRSISTEEKFNFESKIHLPKESFNQSSKCSKSTVKITVPQPFKLSGYDEEKLEAKQRRLNKLKEEKEKQIEKELHVRVVSKPVPKHVYLPLYNEMVEKNQKRKVERKEESLKVVGRSLPVDEPSQTNLNPESNPSDSKPCFKAKPVPKNILSNKVDEKIKYKEEIRKMLRAHRAEEMLKQSSSPLSKKTVSRSYSVIDLSDFKQDRNKVRKSDIAAITNRLFTKKCKETLNNWNDQVNRHSCKETYTKSNILISNNFKSRPEQTLPFLHYPVRMSTAASLRNKQIRSEMLAREKRAELQNNDISEIQQERHEIISNRLHKLIPNIDPDKEIEDRVKNYRESRLNREEEYQLQLEEINKRVSENCLLIERQSKKGNEKTVSLKDVTYEKETISELNSDTDTKSDHLEEKESVSDSDDSRHSESYSE